MPPERARRGRVTGLRLDGAGRSVAPPQERQSASAKGHAMCRSSGGLSGQRIEAQLLCRLLITHKHTCDASGRERYDFL